MPKGPFVGCTEPSWSEWKQVIRDITIVPNSFQSNLQEINVAIEKCMSYTLYSTQHHQLTSFNTQPKHILTAAKDAPKSKFIDAINENYLAQLFVSAEHMTTTNHSSLLLHLALLSLRFESLAEFGNLLVYYINETSTKYVFQN